MNVKNVGMVFQLLATPEQAVQLARIARLASRLENIFWMLWFRAEPVSFLDIQAMRKEKQRIGKWPKMPPFELVDQATVRREGPTPTKIGRALSDDDGCELNSAVYDAIANGVRKLYLKQRFDLVAMKRRVPFIGDEHTHIRFREKAVKILPDPARDGWFRVRLSLRRDAPPLELPLKAVGQARETYDWLRRLADSGEHPSGGMISLRPRGRKKVWQISLSRARVEGERPTVWEPFADRTLVVYAPRDQEVFLRCELIPVRGRPWRFAIEAEDLRISLIADRDRRQRMAAAYRQSESLSGRVGHGRGRVLRDSRLIGARRDRRNNTWIEQRSAFIVAQARKMRCAKLLIERLQDRDPSYLILGTFPYERLVERTKEKAREAGIEAGELKFSEVELLLKSAVETSCVSAGGNDR